MFIFIFMFSTGQTPSHHIDGDIKLLSWTIYSVLSHSLVSSSVLSQIQQKQQHTKTTRLVRNLSNFHLRFFYFKFLGPTFLLSFSSIRSRTQLESAIITLLIAAMSDPQQSCRRGKIRPILQMRKLRPGKVKIILPSALCCSDPFKWATVSSKELPRGPKGRECTQGQDGCQGILISGSGNWAEAKANPAAGGLGLGP